MVHNLYGSDMIEFLAQPEVAPFAVILQWFRSSRQLTMTAIYTDKNKDIISRRLKIHL